MKKYILKSDYTASYGDQRPTRTFKKGDVIEGTEKSIQVFCIKAPCPEIVGSLLLSDGLSIPISVLGKASLLAKVTNAENKDAWTGGTDWSNVFSLRTLFWLVVLVILFYLFMKHVVPVTKQAFGK